MTNLSSVGNSTWKAQWVFAITMYKFGSEKVPIVGLQKLRLTLSFLCQQTEIACCFMVDMFSLPIKQTGRERGQLWSE